MAAAVLARYTTVGNVTYPPGSTPPAAVAKQIDNPKAWAGEAEADASTAQPETVSESDADGV